MLDFDKKYTGLLLVRNINMFKLWTNTILSLTSLSLTEKLTNHLIIDKRLFLFGQVRFQFRKSSC